MSKLKPSVEKDVPIPTGRPLKYQWRDLDVGDSFLAKVKSHSQITSIIAYAKKQTGYGFKMAKVKGGIRVWRIS